MTKSILFWRRIDIDGLERLELTIEPNGITATGTVICLEGGGFRTEHRWRLSPDWQVQWAEIERWNAQDHGMLRMDRVGNGWRVNGLSRLDLDDAEELDLSVTPFCNSFPIYRAPHDIGESLVLDTVFIDGQTLTVQRSRQQYKRQGPRCFRYVDLGLFAGFEADLTVDGNGLIEHYEGLFERIAPRT